MYDIFIIPIFIIPGYAYEQGTALNSIGHHPTKSPNRKAGKALLDLARALEVYYNLPPGSLNHSSMVMYTGSNFCVRCCLKEKHVGCHQVLPYHADVLKNGQKKKTSSETKNNFSKAINGNSQRNNTDIYSVTIGDGRIVGLRCVRKDEFKGKSVNSKNSTLQEQELRGKNVHLEHLSLFKLSYHDETADKKGTHVEHGMQTPIGDDSVSVVYVLRQLETIRYMEEVSSYIQIDPEKKYNFEHNIENNSNGKKKKAPMFERYASARAEWDTKSGPTYAKRIKDELVQSLSNWDNGMTEAELNEVAMDCLSKNNNN